MKRKRRTSRSVGANISESWQKRRYAAHFVSKLSDADGEQAETQHWLDTSLSCSYISVEEHERLVHRYKEIGRMLGKMMSAPESWCGRFGKRSRQQVHPLPVAEVLSRTEMNLYY